MTDRATWNAERYADNNAHHRAYDSDVLAPLSIAPDAKILDIGCGTAAFTAHLTTLVPNGAVVGIDRSDAQIAHAALTYRDTPNLGFATLSAEDVGTLVAVPVLGGGLVGPPFDLAISTATLHWLPGERHLACYQGVRSVLRPQGTFRAEFGGRGQIADVRAVLDEESTRLGGPTSPWYFPEPGEVQANLITAGFSTERGFVRLVDQRRGFPDQASFTGWLESQVLIAYEADLPNGAFGEFTARSLARLLVEARRSDGSYDQDYVRLDFLAHRP